MGQLVFISLALEEDLYQMQQMGIQPPLSEYLNVWVIMGGNLHIISGGRMSCLLLFEESIFT